MCVSQVYWTKELGEAITTEGCRGLTKYGEKCTAELNKIVSLVRGQLTSLERATCGALVVIDVHARDVTVQVGMPAQPSSKSCFEAAAPFNVCCSFKCSVLSYLRAAEALNLLQYFNSLMQLTIRC